MAKFKKWVNEKAQKCKEWTKEHRTDISSVGLGMGIAYMAINVGRFYQFSKYEVPILMELAKKSTELELLKESKKED